jgi:hypothetical protein
MLMSAELEERIRSIIEAALASRDDEWQQRLAELHIGFSGDGCDSGDPIDWSIAAIRMKMNRLIDAADDASELEGSQ